MTTTQTTSETVLEVLTKTGALMTPSAVARKAKTTSHEAWRALQALAAEGKVTTAGNGCWMKYRSAK